ncbi:hypothetical protein HLH89_30505 [Rhizobium laguerreae]|uniref:hypothetical protein n=1 Tax=Rhizobium laguerreae TaxID=1076926 RepID=UPI00147922A4|nr:hypothetical protein [Rhizobium laguerreae]NNH85322.1 hypothetical protein [Rhizobium laguerreae]
MKITYSLTDSEGTEIVGSEVRMPTNLPVGEYTLTTTASNDDGWSRTFSEQLEVTSGGDSDRWMFFATGNRVPGGTSTLPTAGSGLNYVASKLFFGTPSYKTREFRLHWSGFGINEGGTAPQELLAPGNSVVIDKAFLVVGVNKYPIDFSGSTSATIASDANGVWGYCLPGADIPAESVIGVITEYHTGVGEKLLYGYRHQRERGEKIWAAGDLASLEALVNADAASTAAIDTNASYNSFTQFQCFGPDFMLAKGDWDGRPVALVTCDSHGEQRNEIAASADTRRNMGFLRRWLDNPGGIGRIPYFFMGTPGAKASQELATNALKRWAILDEAIAFNTSGKHPFTVILNQLGWNDNNASSATWWNAINSLNGRLKARFPSVKIIGLTVFGKASSTAGYAATATQTVTSPYTTAILGLVNDNIRSNAGGNLDGYIDAFAAWSDPVDSYKWRPYLGMPQRGTFVEQAGTDGTATWNTFKTDTQLGVGFEYRFGTVTGGVVTSSAPNGDGTFTNTRSLSFGAVVPTGTPVYFAVTNDGSHASPGRTVEIADLLQQSDKTKLIV